MLSKMDEMISQLVYYPKYDLMYLHKEDEDYYRYVNFILIYQLFITNRNLIGLKGMR